MKTKNYVHSLCFVAFLCPFVSPPSFGQDSYIKNRWTIKTGFARNNSGITGVPEGVFAGNLRAECSYGISNFIEAGAYLGYSIIDVYTNMVFNSSGFRTSANEPGGQDVGGEELGLDGGLERRAGEIDEVGQDAGEALEDGGGVGTLAGEVALDAASGPEAVFGDGEIVGQLGGQARRAGRLGRLGQVQAAIVADEDELALDGLFSFGPADEGPEGGVGVAALPGERAGDGGQGRPGDELQGERGGDFGRHAYMVAQIFCFWGGG